MLDIVLIALLIGLVIMAAVIGFELFMGRKR